MNILNFSDPAWFTLGSGPTAFAGAKTNDNISVRVFPEWYKQVSLKWEIPASWGNCTFNVFYQETETEDSTRKLNLNPLTSPFYSDTTNQEYSKFREGAYIVEVLLPSGSSVRSAPASWGTTRRSKVEKIANEVQRREYLLLSKFTGVKSFFFRKRMYGQHCTRCWNPTQEKVMDDHCTVCFGTSFEGGYFDPIPVFLHYDPTPNNRLHTPSGRYEPNTITAWTISIPEMSPEDVVIRGGDYNVYRVISNSPTELQTQPVKQVVALTQLSRSDVENALVDRIVKPGSDIYVKDLGKFAKQRFPNNGLDTNSRNDEKWDTQGQTHTLPIPKSTPGYTI